MSEIVVIIRPSFKKICGPDACRAALYNHILYRLARKAKTEPDEKVKKGEIFWYASAEDICTDIDEAWCVNKVRKEVKLLAASGLLGQRHNPLRKWDRRFQYFMSEIEGKALLEKATAEGVCLLHIGLKAEVLHLLHMVNAFDKNGGCICHKEEIDLPNMVVPSTTNGRAITEGTTEGSDTEESTEESDEEKGERDMQAMARLYAVAQTPPLLPSNVVSMSESAKMRAIKTPHSLMAHDEPAPTIQAWGDDVEETVRRPAFKIAPVTQPEQPIPCVIPGGAAPSPATDTLSPCAGSGPRAPGAKQASLQMPSDEKPRLSVAKQIEQEMAHYYDVVQAELPGVVFSAGQRKARNNMATVQAMIDDRLPDETLRRALKKLSAWERQNFNLRRFYEEWMPAKLATEPTLLAGRPRKDSTTLADGKTDLRYAI